MASWSDAETFGDLRSLFPRRARVAPSGPSLASRARSGVSVISEETARALKAGGETARNYVSQLSTEALDELRTWAAFRQPNYWYILFNGIQIVTCIAVLVIGFVTVQEARDDLKENVAFKLMDSASTVKVNPCGYPAPDMLHLLRLQGVYENQFGLPQLIEPDYKKWNVRVQGSMCASDPYWDFVGNDKARDTSTNEKAQLLHGLATIMGRSDLEPTDAADTAHLDAIEAAMLNDMCNTESNRTYSKRLKTAFGDPMTRIARAYLAAAPAFRAYQQSKSDAAFNGGTCLGDLDPFGYAEPSTGVFESPCSNADYINVVLQRAGSVHNSARLAGIAEDTAPSGGTEGADFWHSSATQFVSGPLEMLYALYALSIINHYDKTNNGGLCFKNADAESAVAFCDDLYGAETNFGAYTLPSATDPLLTVYGATILDVNYYRMSDDPIDTKYTCTASSVSGITLATSEAINVPHPPSPPPFVSYRGADSKYAVVGTGGNPGATDAVKKHVIGSCAATMQYGLYDQERLFGVPDVLHFFQHDNRPDASLHFLGGITANSYYLGPLDEADAFKRPVERLELYLAYRLASLTLWGAIVASVTGFFIGRSGVPLGIAILSLIFGIKDANGVRATIVQPSGRSIFQDTFTILAAVAGLVAAYYTIFVDPSAQSYYPTTPKCNDFILGSKYVHSAGGAYVTSWGKRRFNRYSETQIGIVLIFMALVPVIYTFTKVWAQTRAKLDKEKRVGMTIFTTSINVVFLLAAGTIVGSQVYNCINTGNNWMEAARVSPYDTTALNDALGRDCLAMVLMSFWVGLALSVNRASWVMNSVRGIIYRLAFFGGCVFTVWLNQISYLALLPDEYADAFSYPSKDEHRRNAQIIALTGSGLFTGAILIEFWSLQKELGGGGDASEAQGEVVTDIKTEAQKLTENSLFCRASAPDAASGFFKLATTHIDPRALRGAAPAQPQPTGAAAALSRLPLPREQRRAPIGTRSRGQYAPMQPAAMPHLNLRH